MTAADKLARRQVHLEQLIAEAKVKVVDLEVEARNNLEELEHTLAEDGVGAVAERPDGKFYIYADDLADGSSAVLKERLDLSAPGLRKHPELADLAPREVVTVRYPTIAEITKKKAELRAAGFRWRDFIDWAPKKTGLRCRKVEEDTDV